MEGAICIGKVSSVGKFRVCVDQEHNERHEDGTILYEHYVFDRWAFWNDVSVGDWCKVSVSHHGQKVITTVEKIDKPAAEQVA